MRLDKKILYFILYWILYSGLIEIYIIRTPFIPIVADFLLIILLIKRTAFKASQIKKCLGHVIPIIIYLFITLGTISSLLNLITVPTYLWGLHYYIRYWILLICAYRTFNKHDVLKIKRILYKATFINIILCIIQVAMGIKGDPLGGTFSGGNAEIALLIIMMTIIVSCDYFYKYISLKKALLIVCGFLFIAILGEIKFLYFVIPLCMYGCYTFIKKGSIKPIIILIILFFTFIPIMKGVLSLYYDENYVEMVFDENKIDENIHSAHNFQERGMNRGTSVQIVTTYILKNKYDLLFGKGIGAGSASSLFSSSIYQEFRDTNYYNFTLAYVLVECGWIGLILFCLTYAFLFLHFFRIYLTYTDSQIKYWTICGSLGSVMTGMLIWYNAEVLFAFYIYFFFYSICFIAIRERKQFLRDQIKINGKSICNSSCIQR